jgi:hypothetical protein
MNRRMRIFLASVPCRTNRIPERVLISNLYIYMMRYDKSRRSVTLPDRDGRDRATSSYPKGLGTG